MKEGHLLGFCVVVVINAVAVLQLCVFMIEAVDESLRCYLDIEDGEARNEL